MNKKQQFEDFLESLKGHEQDILVESVKKGFQICFEAENIRAIDEILKELRNRTKVLEDIDSKHSEEQRKIYEKVDEMANLLLRYLENENDIKIIQKVHDEIKHLYASKTFIDLHEFFEKKLNKGLF